MVIKSELLILVRFLPPSVAEKYDLDIPDYPEADQVMELSGPGKGQEDLESKAEKILKLAERQDL